MSPCPFLRLFTPEGRAHTYELCAATGEVPLCPSAEELLRLCRGRFEECPRYQAGRASEAQADEAVPERRRRGAA